VERDRDRNKNKDRGRDMHRDMDTELARLCGGSIQRNSPSRYMWIRTHGTFPAACPNGFTSKHHFLMKAMACRF
jgi:hypothetical protein